MKWKLINILCMYSLIASAQSEYAKESRAWHNRKPHPGYWQQDVNYTINATINEKEHRIDAEEKLIYTNNSPQSLDYVFFHLYQNAFVKGSHLDDLYHANHVPTEFGKNLSIGNGIKVYNLKVDGVEVKTELQNTILKVYLPKTLKTGQSCTFTMNFNTWWDNSTIRRRMQFYDAWGFMHYNGVHWYPRISVFDHKKGWDTDQHLNKELYGDFGLFDVKLNFPSNYIVEATGELMNRAEVLPPDLWAKLQIKNFANKRWNEPPSTIIPYREGERKTWHYKAKHVHDFAFTADPSYRIEEKDYRGVKCVAIVQEPHAARWQNAATYVTKIIKELSNGFGDYEYPKIVAADANDGMEYPMLTLDGGGDPDYRGLLVHEIGHNWFYGMIGNNETYRAALDEGFTQFATAYGLQKIDGDTMVEYQDRRPYIQKHREIRTVWDRNFLTRYTLEALRGDDKRLNTHSNHFDGALGHENGYGLVYHKTATMLLNLQYTLGDSLFQSAMKHYVEKWKFCHPYFEDFREAITEHVGTDMDWFFDQWLETTKQIDYSIKEVKEITNSRYRIKLAREGSMQMPIDIQVTDRNGTKYSYYIPNTQWFRKSTSATVLPTWYGWDNLNPTYEFDIDIPAGIKKVMIDPTYRLADIQMTNNSSGVGKLFASRNTIHKLDYGLRQALDRRARKNYYRPDLWYNAIDGVKIGFHGEGNYMNALDKAETNIWLNTGVLAQAKQSNATKLKNLINYTIKYETPLRKIHQKLNGGFSIMRLDGYQRMGVFASAPISKKSQVRLDVVNLFRYFTGNNSHALYPTNWSSYSNLPYTPDQVNNFVQAQYRKNTSLKDGNGLLTLTARSSYPSLWIKNNLTNYAFLQGEYIHRNSLKKLDFNTRLFSRVGFGNHTPLESGLNLAGANNEEMIDNKWTRATFDLNNPQLNMSNNSLGLIHAGGGLNVRGYTGYYALEQDQNGLLYLNSISASGLSFSEELEFDRLIKLRPKATRNWLKTDLYVFTDIASIQRNGINPGTFVNAIQPVNALSKVRADAGIGSLWTIKHWGRYEKARPFTLRVDFPVYLNSVPFNYPYHNLSLRRVVIGFGRSF